MHPQLVVQALTYLEPASSLGALALIWRRGLTRQYRPLVLLLAVRLTSFCLAAPLFYLAHAHSSLRMPLYIVYFYLYWLTYALEAILGFFIIFGVFSLAMAPLRGLERLGRLMFWWAGGIAIALALTTALGPHVTARGFLMKAVTELQQTQSILTLCMLLFVSLAIRPMGLSHRSKIFGVCLGLAVTGATDLVGSAWLAHTKSMYSAYSLISQISVVLSVAIWIGYFAIPEPKRRMIVLPTTSPFLRWNQISAALGDEPGYVAVGEVTADMFAPAEVEIMHRAIVKMRVPITS